ncbi:YbaB/EbfC family nucleoid-associated protein [Rhodococcus xishaensis]|uniref:YbaB/EbfC family DNA-binding protein n=1 Tax=Rhodococcus xishaensis TaxID=2487364 RepID=A0A438B2K0_9NOCA|nr:YbaB/EbfC family nucleoid-associated protein [Rhodococcus xishaensis]RVW05190.1 YbaB/EbfC family DNA-binding protein [Rhodococcus xishaensis]
MSGGEMDALVERATAALNLLDDALTSLDTIRAEAVSEDGRVRVEVDGNARPTGIWLSDSLHDLDARRLAQTITQTAHRAAAAAAAERARVTSTLFDTYGKG